MTAVEAKAKEKEKLLQSTQRKREAAVQRFLLPESAAP